MTDPRRAAVRVVVAGTAGGVGTTTAAAMVFDGLRASASGAPALHDHSGGDLGERLANGDEVARVDPLVAVHDLGAHALGPGVDVLADPHDVLVAVAPSTPLGFREAGALLADVADRFGVPAVRRTVLVLNAPFGRYRDAPAVEALRGRYERLNVIELPRDPALAAGGRIALPRLAPRTRRAQHVLGHRVADIVRQHRSSRLRSDEEA